MNVSDTKSETDDADTGIQEVMKCNELTLRGVLYKAETELAEARIREGHNINEDNITVEQSSQHHDATGSSIAPPLPTKTNRTSSRPKRGRKNSSHESPVRIVLATHVPMVTESLFNYQRCIDGKTLSLLHTTNSNNSNYDDDHHQHHHHGHYHRREHLVNIDRALTNRATSFLRRWRLAIQVGDEINCPDYMDEYEHDDEQRGWIKLYAAVVIDVSADCKTQVPVGDSSADLDSRAMREIKPGEKAIFVHYVGYPKEQNRWIMMSPSEYVTDTDISYHIFPRDSHQKSLQALQNLYNSSNMELEEALEGEEGDEQDHSDDDGEESSTDDESDNDDENNDEDDNDDSDDSGEDTDHSDNNVTPKPTRTTKVTRLANAHDISASEDDTATDEVEVEGVKKKKSTKAVSPSIGRRSPRISDTPTEKDASPQIPIVGKQPLRKPHRGRRRVQPKPGMEISKPKRELEKSPGGDSEEQNDKEEKEEEDIKGKQHNIDIAENDPPTKPNNGQIGCLKDKPRGEMKLKEEDEKDPPTKPKKGKVGWPKGRPRGKKKPKNEHEKDPPTKPSKGKVGSLKGKPLGKKKPKEEDEKDPPTKPKKGKVGWPKGRPRGKKKPKEETQKVDFPKGVPTETSAINNITILSNTRPGGRERRIAVPRALQLEQEQAIEELQQKRKKRTVDDALKVKKPEKEEVCLGKSQCTKKRKASIAIPKRGNSSTTEIKKEQPSKKRKASIATTKRESSNATEIKKENSAKILPETPQPGANKRTRAKRTPIAKTKEEPKQKTKKKETKPSSNDEELDFTWICTECREAECITHPDSPLLICEGKCNRPFHYPCAGLPAMPATDEKWICNDCTEGRHKCSCCHTYGVDNDDVFCCSVKGCGLFFHESCLNMFNVEVEVENVEVRYPNEEEHGSDSPSIPHIVSRPRFKCPAHICWTCHQDSPPPPEEVETDEGTKNEKGQKGKKRKKKRLQLSAMEKAFQPKPEGRLYRCLECPVAYHISCIPPTSRFHELALLCHEHACTCKLPDLELESSFQGQVEADADKRLERAIKANNKKDPAFKIRTRKSIENMNAFFPGMVGYAKTENERTMLNKFDVDFSTTLDMRFCLPCDFKNEVHSKPPAYRQVHSLRYDPANKPKRKPPSGESCKCKKSCDENCFNRMVGMECIGDGRKGKGEKNPYWNCNCGPECGNRALSQRKFAKCRPQREQGKGWGLITVNGVKKGALVQEYVGSIIDDETKEERLRSWALDHPNDPNFYIMALDSGWFIDAREEANMSRFINHSCDPNCHLVRLNVGGQMRVGIFSIKDIPAGDFLSYDYQFDTKDGDKFVCRCGAKGCRGTMKGGKGLSGDDTEKKTKKQVRLEAKAGYDRDKKFLEDVERKAPKRLWHVGVMVPGATDGTESVARGPQDRYRDIALRNRLFLWRNVMRGANFAARYATFQSGRKRIYSELLGETIDEVDVLSILEQVK